MTNVTPEPALPPADAPSPYVGPVATVTTVPPAAPASTTNGVTPLNIHPKVAAAAVTDAITVLVIWIVALTGHTLPTEFGALIAAVVAAVAGYFAPNAV